MSGRRFHHPPPEVTLGDWFGGAYQEYAILLQPFYAAPTPSFSEEARKASPAITWEEAATELGLSRWALARVVHTVLASLAGAPPAPDEHLRLLTGKQWALPPEDQIGSGVERVIGHVLSHFGVGSTEARDEFDVGRSTLLVSDLCLRNSVFHRIRNQVEPVAKLLSEDAPIFFVAASDWPHVLVCGVERGISDVLLKSGAEFVTLQSDEYPRRWWHPRVNW